MFQATEVQKYLTCGRNISPRLQVCLPLPQELFFLISGAKTKAGKSEESSDLGVGGKCTQKRTKNEKRVWKFYQCASTNDFPFNPHDHPMS